MTRSKDRNEVATIGENKENKRGKTREKSMNKDQGRYCKLDDSKGNATIECTMLRHKLENRM